MLILNDVKLIGECERCGSIHEVEKDDIAKLKYNTFAGKFYTPCLVCGTKVVFLNKMSKQEI